MTKSKTIGSTLIIAGTTIGAGMLALPIASAGIGFTASIFTMIALWALMAFTALLMVELHQYADHDATLHTLATQILGNKGKFVGAFAMLFLFYALCAAYIAGGGAQFNSRLNDWTSLDLSPSSVTVVFTLIVATIITIGTSTVDKVNRVLFIVKIITMAMVLSFLAPNVTRGYLMSMPVEQGLIFAALPVVFTSFGFHGSIPSIVRYLDGDTKSLRKVMLIGSSLPLVIYIFWQTVTLGVIEQNLLIENSGLTALISTLSATVNSEKLASIVSVFADLALLTSFLGVSLGLFEFLNDVMSSKSESSSANQSKTNRIKASLVTFTPPLGFALFYPEGFITALGYAAIALVILAIFLPVIMVHKVRRTQCQDNMYQVIGGSAALFVAMATGIMIISAQLLVTVGALPALG
ncbi:aromatic amino acid transport family protein [Vibrio mexicanus]|uniref:aromatic amino acid transport family protein n=1 Tax=Vibrio mexicanus TaxID=1004326 RepID=UPI00063CEF3B|nr:aromatic amino acid transport family protein [Vibrio mexicanus]